MTVYVFGAGASVSAGYPLASQLLQSLSTWLDRCDSSEFWVREPRNRIAQVRATFGSLDDFEGILGGLEENGQKRLTPNRSTTYCQDPKDLLEGQMEQCRSGDVVDTEAPASGINPNHLRSDLISAFRQFFYHVEASRTGPNAYDGFAERRVGPDSAVITFNYDIAIERAMAKAGKWDVGNGYGFSLVPNRPLSSVTVYKLHGSVNWFKYPFNDAPPPFMFQRDISLLGYGGLSAPQISENGKSVDDSGTCILPDPRKQFYWKEFWDPLWSAAAERLSAAQEVFIHGYSMPATDCRARQLLFDNIPKSAKISVYCLDTSDRIAKEFRNFGFSDVQSFPSLSFEAWADCHGSPRL